MNKIVLCGRLAADPEVRYSTGEIPVAISTYRLAVDRPFAIAGQQQADFIPCKAIGKAGEFAERYLRKGMKMVIAGELRADQYQDKDGNKRTSYVVQVREHEFCEKKEQKQEAAAPAGDFMSIPEDEGIPFTF